LHLDDVNTLYYIKKELGGIGTVQRDFKHYRATYAVWNFNDIYNIIVPIFENYKLLTCKKYNFSLFKKAVKLKHRVNLNRSKGMKILDTEFQEFQNIKMHMSCKDKKVVNENVPKNIINANWLLGFIEGEGTFGYKYTVPYFQIAQNIRDKDLLDDINIYFNQLIKKNSSLKKNFNMIKVINNKTKVLSYTIQDTEILYKYIIPFFSTMDFKTRKKLDYEMWILAIDIRINGYHLIKQGKSILFKISKGTNKYRYSNSKNNNVKLPTKDEINDLYSLSPIYDENIKLTYKERALKYALKIKRRKGYIVHVYKDNKEIDQSPILSYKLASKILNINSNIISRFIDTGKLYKNKYMFSSEKIQK